MLLALGFGAGLSAQEVMGVRAGDVVVVDDVVLARVAEGRVRTVPVLKKWEKALVRRAAELKASDYLFKPGRTSAGKNLTSNFIASAKETMLTRRRSGCAAPGSSSRWQHACR